MCFLTRWRNAKISPATIQSLRFPNARYSKQTACCMAIRVSHGRRIKMFFGNAFAGRFKRCGQFGSPPGMADLLALAVACRNFDWNALWSQN